MPVLRPASQLEGDKAIDLPSADSMHREIDRFVGEWTMQVSPPGGPPWPGEARVHFEWIDGHAFQVERWTLDLPELSEGTPTSGTSIFSCDAAYGTYFQLHFDDRGVRRVYEMGPGDGQWTLRRDGPPYAQRFAADGKTITGRWEIAEEPQDWRTNFDVTYTRVSKGVQEV